MWEFAEFPDPKHHYYKSECHPLLELTALHRIGIVGHDHKHGFREWLDMRDRARKDLYWLGHDCIATPESGSAFVEHVHREMCGMFVQKNFDGVYHKGYTLDTVRAAIDRHPREKEMLMLCPTGAFKSTANKIDAAQWMLNMPDIRIFIMTGSGALSRKFLKEVKGFFYKPEHAGYTYFQSLFPEYVIEGADGDTMAPMFCPARMRSQPGTPTLWVNSIDGAVAGWHCDIWKGDDIVNEDNSNTEDTRDNLKQRYDNISQNRPDRWAFKDHLGTRYFPDDWYGSRIDEAKKYPDTNALKYLRRAAWTVKPGFENVPIKLLQEHMVDIYFPEFMPFRILMAKCRQNEKAFRCQQLNEPAGSDLACDFDEATLHAHLILQTKVPRPENSEPRKTVITWDTAHGNSSGSDYSAGAVGYCHEQSRTLYVLEVRDGKWKDSDLAIQIVDMHMKWKPLFTEIEKFAGWELLAAEIQRVAMRRFRTNITVVWRAVDMTAGAKRNRVKGLEALLANDRLYFVEGEWIENAFQQFVRFTGFSKKRKDDIPDAISFLQRLIPAERRDPDGSVESESERKAREAAELKEEFARQHTDAAYRTIFQAQAVPKPPAPSPEAAEEDSRADIFGGTGLHL